MATMVGRKGESAIQVPSSSTFSFKAPFPVASTSSAALKQRRVSLALPSTPKVQWDFRDDTGVDSHVPETETMPEKRSKLRKTGNGSEKNEMPQEKKQRKKWTEEETQMLVTGCNIHGVGNWKTILSDPNLKFDNRSPVDLKDRFRTYFPDAYKEHYPNARTHLSSKVRSTLPDGTSLFEKTRSKKRRPFTEEEDRALKAGYEKHGTVWAAIVKDPIFREQGRRSTDLRDRFRNAFPDLYKAAGYKPRNSAKKKLLAESGGIGGIGSIGGRGPIRAADDQLPLSSTGPVRSRRRAHTNQGLLRGGTKSVPQSAAASEDEDSSGAEDDGPMFKTPHTPVLVDNVSTSSQSGKLLPFDDDDIDMVTFDHVEPLGEFLSSAQGAGHFSQLQDTDKHSQTWSSGVNTPTHSVNAWSTAAGSPTSSHLSADLLGNSHSPFQRRTDPFFNNGMIGKSAWGTQDWFSANPRMDPGSSGIQNNSNNIDDALSPASPFSFHNLNHGVLDRYDLHPPLYTNDFASEVGAGDNHSTFSDEAFPPGGFRGFTHHSNFAGDLIFGARTHQPVQGFGGFADFNNFGGGLGLSGMSQNQGIHPMQLTMSGLDEMGLAGISLDDDSSSSVHNDSSLLEDTNIADLMISDPHTNQPQDDSHSRSQDMNNHNSSLGGIGSSVERFSLDDLVDLSGHEHMDVQHSTPPATPLMSPERSGRRSNTFHGLPGVVSSHGRSISVPPTDARIPANVSAPAVLDLPGANPGTYSPPSSRPIPQRHPESQPNMSSTIRTGGFYGQERPRQSSDAAVTPSAMTAPLAKDDSQIPSSSMDHHHHTLYPNHLLDPHNELSWRAALGHSSTDGNLNLPFLDLHYYGLHPASSASGGVNGPGGGGGGGGGLNMEDYDAVTAQALRQGQALDLAQPLASGSSINLASFAGSSNMGPPLSSHKGLGFGSSSFKQQFGQVQPSQLGHPHPPPTQATPTTPVGPGGHGSDAQQMSLGEGVDKMNAMFGASATGTIRARRSQGGHHRSQTQSGINPQELMLGTGTDNTKRKRLSWDGSAQ